MHKWIPGFLGGILGAFITPTVQPIFNETPRQVIDLQGLTFMSAVNDPATIELSPFRADTEEALELERLLLNKPVKLVSVLESVKPVSVLESVKPTLPKTTFLASIEREVDVKLVFWQDAISKIQLDGKLIPKSMSSAKVVPKSTQPDIDVPFEAAPSPAVKSVPKFPSLATVEQQADAKQAAKQAAQQAAPQATQQVAPQAEVTSDDVGFEAGSIKAPPKLTLEQKVDRLESAMVLLVSALSRTNNITTQDAQSLSAKLVANVNGKVEVSESGMITTQRVATQPVVAQQVVTQAGSASDNVIRCVSCGCNCVATADGRCPCCNRNAVSQYNGGYYQAYSGNQASGGSTGSYRTQSGGSTGNAASYNNYAAYNAQPAYSQPAQQFQSVSYAAQPAQTVRAQPAQTQRRGLFGRRTTVAQQSSPARGNCSYQLGADGQWYQVCSN